MKKTHNRAKITFLDIDEHELGDIEFKTTKGKRRVVDKGLFNKEVNVNYSVSARKHALQLITHIDNMTDDKFIAVNQDRNDMVRRSEITRMCIEEYTVEEDI